jgi:hypothetical protein
MDPLYVAQRSKFWNLMEDLVLSFSSQWLLIEDLNSISCKSEKRGGSKKGEGSSRSFINFVDKVGAIDLGFCRSQFTSSNKRVGLANIRERLDRGICNADWQCLFPKAGVRHLVAPTSDHNPILLDTYMERSFSKRPVRFEAIWTKDESSIEVVERAWQIDVKRSYAFQLAKKFQIVKREFLKWNKEHFGQTRTRIKELERKIEVLQGMDLTTEVVETEAALCIELNDWLEREELKWRQKSREIWLKEDDKNSRFFHLSTLVRRRRNFIREIKLEDGQWIQSKTEIDRYFAINFQNLFQSSNP